MSLKTASIIWTLAGIIHFLIFAYFFETHRSLLTWINLVAATLCFLESLKLYIKAAILSKNLFEVIVKHVDDVVKEDNKS